MITLFCVKILEERQKSLPFMYWLPKMHYTPSQSRFIVASSSCSTKPLSKLASSIYKHIFNQVRSFHDKIIFIAPEIKGDLSLPQAVFQSMVSGEDTVIPQKHKKAIKGPMGP